MGPPPSALTPAAPLPSTEPTGPPSACRAGAAPGGAGGSVPAHATLAGGASATGAIVFSLYANTTCTGTPVATASASVTGDGSYTSGNLPVAAAGVYTWVVSYSGDVANSRVATPCGAQPVSVAKATPTLTTPPAPGLAGGN